MRKPKPTKTLASSVPLTGNQDIRDRTYPGMAHWAGSGPQGKSCRQCVHWSCEGYFANGTIKPGRCVVAARLMAVMTPKVPHYASACRYFFEDPAAPAPNKETR